MQEFVGTALIVGAFLAALALAMAFAGGADEPELHVANTAPSLDDGLHAP